jgi:hypothetical protein
MKKRKGLNRNEVIEMAESAKAISDATGAVVIGQNAGFGYCEYCGSKDEELRPYGKNGANICYRCGQANLKETEKNMGKFLFGE